MIKIKYMIQSWHDFIHVMLNPTLEDALLIVLNGALFTFGVLAFFWAWINFSLFAAIVTAAMMYFFAVIVNQYITNFFECHETENHR